MASGCEKGLVSPAFAQAGSCSTQVYRCPNRPANRHAAGRPNVYNGFMPLCCHSSLKKNSPLTAAWPALAMLLVAVLQLVVHDPASGQGEPPATPAKVPVAFSALAERAQAAGFRRVEGERLVLFTDLPANPEIDALPRVFDQAYPQWCAYFSLPDQLSKPWRMHAFLMGDRSRFKTTGVLPAELPPFAHGFCAGMDLWFDEQPSAYYRRHLLLHEGTHGFMHTVLGGVGPLWYAEGMAELLGTHHWADGRLKLDWFPRSREEVPMLGRIKTVYDAVAAGQPRSLAEILGMQPDNRFVDESYAWCWAAAALLDGDPRYQARFPQVAPQCANGPLQRTGRRAIQGRLGSVERSMGCVHRHHRSRL